MTIALGTLRRFAIPLPPPAEQRRIVARIEALFARTRRARADLERIAPLSRRYVEAATDRAFTPGENGAWSTTTAGQLCDIKSGVTLGKRYAPEAELIDRPYLRVANVQRGHLRLDEIKTVRLSAAEASRLILREGDILMNEGGDRDKLGRGWVWEGQLSECVHQNHVFRSRLRNDVVTPKFVSRYANHAVARYFLDEGKQTTNLASISMSKVAGLSIPVPPAGEAARSIHFWTRQIRQLETCRLMQLAPSPSLTASNRASWPARFAANSCRRTGSKPLRPLRARKRRRLRAPAAAERPDGTHERSCNPSIFPSAISSPASGPTRFRCFSGPTSGTTRAGSRSWEDVARVADEACRGLPKVRPHFLGSVVLQ